MLLDAYRVVQTSNTEHDQPLTRHHLAMGEEI